MIFRLGDHIEEDIVGWLKAAGYQVEGQQDAFSDHDGWFSGHCGGIIHGITQQPHILEIKSAKDKEFKSVTDHARVELAKKRELMERQGKGISLKKVGNEQRTNFKMIYNYGRLWRKCMGIEPTRDGISAPHRI